MDLNLKFNKCPEVKKFSKEEEKKYFPNPGETVLCLLKNGEYSIVDFSFLYQSFKSNENGEFIRDGNGETIWESEKYNYQNNKMENEVVGWYRLYN